MIHSLDGWWAVIIVVWVKEKFEECPIAEIASSSARSPPLPGEPIWRVSRVRNCAQGFVGAGRERDTNRSAQLDKVMAAGDL